MVAQDEVDPLGIFRFQPGHVFQNGMRHASAVFRVSRAAVTDFLENQVAAAMLVQAGQTPDQVEIAAMSVQVAGDHHLVGHVGRQHDDVSLLGRAFADWHWAARPNVAMIFSAY